MQDSEPVYSPRAEEPKAVTFTNVWAKFDNKANSI